MDCSYNDTRIGGEVNFSEMKSKQGGGFILEFYFLLKEKNGKGKTKAERREEKLAGRDEENRGIGKGGESEREKKGREECEER
jgi:hypothetical protein